MIPPERVEALSDCCAQISRVVFKGGTPAQRLTSMTGHNGLSMNCPGVALAPSQVTLLVLG